MRKGPKGLAQPFKRGYVHLRGTQLAAEENSSLGTGGYVMCYKGLLMAYVQYAFLRMLSPPQHIGSTKQ